MPGSNAQAYYDRQYNARASVQDAAALIARYTQESQAASQLRAIKNVAYSARSTDVLDIYLPQSTQQQAQGAPVFIFIHGGYWRALSKNDSAFMAPALTQAGAMVVVPEYDLAPAVTLDHIVDQMRQMFAWVVRNIAIYGGDARNICVCGSSAGGHLVGMLLAKGWQEDYDLPASATPDASTHSQCQLRVAVGEFESREFHRQSREYLTAWNARLLPGQWVEAPATNHFDLPLQLADPQSIVHQTALQLMGLSTPAP